MNIIIPEAAEPYEHGLLDEKKKAETTSKVPSKTTANILEVNRETTQSKATQLHTFFPSPSNQGDKIDCPNVMRINSYKPKEKPAKTAKLVIRGIRENLKTAAERISTVPERPTTTRRILTATRSVRELPICPVMNSNKSRTISDPPVTKTIPEITMIDLKKQLSLPSVVDQLKEIDTKNVLNKRIVFKRKSYRFEKKEGPTRQIEANPARNLSFLHIKYNNKLLRNDGSFIMKVN